MLQCQKGISTFTTPGIQFLSYALMNISEASACQHAWLMTPWWSSWSETWINVRQWEQMTVRMQVSQTGWEWFCCCLGTFHHYTHFQNYCICFTFTDCQWQECWKTISLFSSRKFYLGKLFLELPIKVNSVNDDISLIQNQDSLVLLAIAHYP